MSLYPTKVDLKEFEKTVEVKDLDLIKRYLADWNSVLGLLAIKISPITQDYKDLQTKENRNYLKNVLEGFTGYDDASLSYLFDRFFEFEVLHKYLSEDLGKFYEILNRITYWTDYTGNLGA